MKVAVAYENGEIYGHFGHCPQFAVYEYGEYVYDCVKTLVDTSALAGHQAMADKMLVMHRGEAVEQGMASFIMKSPSSPYTQKLLAAMPKLRR